MTCWSAAGCRFAGSGRGTERVHQRAALADGERERLFAIDILARPHRGGGYGSVPVVGGADEDDVDVVPRHEFLVRGEDADVAGASAGVLGLAVGGLDTVAHLLGLGAHDVTGRDDPAVVGQAEKRAGVRVADEAVADEPDGESIARGGLAE
jgi:hypothetical protein